MTGAGYRVGIDVGGTFTDLVLADPASGRLVNHKEPSTPLRPFGRGREGPSQPDRRGPGGGGTGGGGGPWHHNRPERGTPASRRPDCPGGLSRGNRDVLEIARCRMASPYDIFARKEDPLVPRDRVFDVLGAGPGRRLRDGLPD